MNIEDDEESVELNEEQKESLNRIIGRLTQPNLKPQSLPSLVLEQEEKRLAGMFSLEGAFYFHGHVYQFDPKSLFIMHYTGRARKMVVWLTTLNWFDRVIITLIFLNSISLAIYDYSDRDDITQWNKNIDKSGLFFTIMFTIECVCKVLTMGFIFHRNSYLRDGWNWIDFLVVIVGQVLQQRIIEIIPGIPNLRALRTLRVLRPLKSINAIPSMRRLVQSLIESLPALGNVVVFLLFVFILFGILGVQIFNGGLYSHCRTTTAPISPGVWPSDESVTRLCSVDGGGLYQCPAGQEYCGSPIQYDITLEQDGVDNNLQIFYGIPTFDNLSSGILTVFQIITLEGWVDLMYNFMDSKSAVISIIFFVLVVLFGSFFLLNLILAVIMDNFNSDAQTEEDESKIENMLERRKIQQLKQETPVATAEGKQTPELELLQDSSKQLRPIEEVLEDNFHDIIEDEVETRAFSNKFYMIFYKICNHNLFNVMIILFIFANTIILAMDREPISEEESSNLESANRILAWLFFGEMVIKLFGLGFHGYSLDRFNLFDCAIVIISVVEEIIGLFNIGDSVSSGGAISAFRGVRLLRVFKLARSWKSFHDMLQKIGKSLKEIVNFSILLFLFMFTYTLLGMELFAYKVKYNEETDTVDHINGTSPRTNFDYFLPALTTIFIVLIGEDWNFVMYEHVRATNSLAILFFVSLVIFGNWILLNLFLAILLKNFEDEEEQEEEEKGPSVIHKLKEYIKGKCCIKKISQDNEIFCESPRENQRISTCVNESIEDEQKQCVNTDAELIERHQERQPPLTKSTRKAIHLDDFINESESKKKVDLEGISLFIMNPQNKFRIISSQIVAYKYFDTFILFMIFFSTFLLTLENPLDDPNGSLQTNLFYIDIFVTFIFVFECVIKIIVSGFMFSGPQSYIRNSWNIMDFMIVLFSLVSIFTSQYNLSFLKVLRILRVLRPLRVISRNEGLKIAVQSLFNSAPGILNVLVISLLFFLLFGILGTNYFKGQYFKCFTDHLQIDRSILITSQDCVENGGVWYNKEATFDDSLSALMALFEMSTTEGWIGVMWDGVDSAGIGYVPIQNNREEWVFFFISFIIVGSLFVLNLFVGVVINTFNDEKEKLGKNHLLTDRQRDWIQINLMCFKSRPIMKTRMTDSVFRNKMIKLAEHWLFETFIMTLIIFNTIILALKWYDEDPQIPKTLEIINYAFAGIFTIEAIIKLIAFDLDYFKDGWNVFDFIIVIGTLVGIIINTTTKIKVGPQTTIIRAFRIGRIFRLVKKAKSLKMIFQTFVITIPSLANVGGLLILLIYIYAVLGVFLFAQIKLQDTLNSHANFQNFGTAFLTLFRMATGEAWNSLMNDAKRKQNVLFDCNNDTNYNTIQANGGIPDGCGSSAAVPFFLTFMLVVPMIFLNLFIAIILEGFNNTSEAEDLPVQESTLDQFTEVWSEFDQTGSGFIQVTQLNQLIERLAKVESQFIVYPDQLKFDKQRDNMIANLRVPCYGQFQKYHFHDVLRACTKYVMSINFIKEKILKEKEIDFLTNAAQQGLLDSNQKELLLEDFDFVISDLEERGEKDKIAMHSSLKKIDTAFMQKMKNKKIIDHHEGRIFDSSFIVMIPKIQYLARKFLTKQRLLKQDPDQKFGKAQTIQNNSKNEEMTTIDTSKRRQDFSRSVSGSASTTDMLPTSKINEKYKRKTNNVIEEEVEYTRRVSKKGHKLYTIPSQSQYEDSEISSEVGKKLGINQKFVHEVNQLLGFVDEENDLETKKELEQKRLEEIEPELRKKNGKKLKKNSVIMTGKNEMDDGSFATNVSGVIDKFILEDTCQDKFIPRKKKVDPIEVSPIQSLTHTPALGQQRKKREKSVSDLDLSEIPSVINSERM